MKLNFTNIVGARQLFTHQVVKQQFIMYPSSTLDEQFLPKFTLCVLVTQFGKTFTAIEHIKKGVNKNAVNFIFTMNTFLNNEQFANRLHVIEDEYGPGSVVIFSSKYEGTYKHVRTKNQVYKLCSDESTCPKVVLMCSNKRRFEDSHNIINRLDESKSFSKKLNLYYDELHMYISKFVRSQIEVIHDMDIVSNIVGLTASPSKIIKNNGRWNRTRIMRIDNYDSEDYVSVNDMRFVNINDYFEHPYIRLNPFTPGYYDKMDGETIGFIRRVLTNNPHILGTESRTFIPGHIRRIGHTEIRDYVMELNPRTVVVTLNSDKKAIEYMREGELKSISLIDTTNNKEVSEKIAEIVLTKFKNNRPLVITGYLCIGTGQTLMHESLGSFTSAIIGHMDLTNDKIYQLFGRLTGRMKNWNTYTKTTVYCTNVVMNRCKMMEKLAMNTTLKHNGKMLDKHDYFEPLSEASSTTENHTVDEYSDECESVLQNFRQHELV